MKLVSCMCCHNEDWAIGLSLRVALKWNDAVVVLLHACSDGSARIVEEVGYENPGRVYVIVEDNPRWDEMAHRQWMLEVAREIGATHASMTDCDEILSGNLIDSIRWHVERLEPRQVLELPGYNLRGGIGHFHANGVWGNRWFAAAFRDDPMLGWGGDRFHHREPMGAGAKRRPVPYGSGGIMHLWGASERRLIAKHAAYKISERLRWPDKPVREIDRMYSLAIHGEPRTDANRGGFGTPETWRYLPVPDAWWWPYRDLMSYLDLDSPPTAEAECERLIAEHGIERFAGLDLFRGLLQEAVA